MERPPAVVLGLGKETLLDSGRCGCLQAKASRAWVAVREDLQSNTNWKLIMGLLAELSTAVDVPAPARAVVAPTPPDRDSKPLACDRDIVTGPPISERDAACQCGSRFTWTDHEGTEHCVWCASRGRSEGCLYAWLDNQDRWHCCGCDPAPSPGHPLRFAVARFVKAVTLPPFIPGCEFAWDEFRPVKL